MTRLKTEDIHHICSSLELYNQSLIKKTGNTLWQIAAHAAGVKKEDLYQNIKAAVIPLTCGLGVIEGFSQSVKSIISFLGLDAFVTETTDAGGLAEAIENGAQVLLTADDNRFIAANTLTGKVSDNGEATGRGYTAGLDLMVGGLQKKQVLIIGAGPVGRGAAYAAARFGAIVSVFDINESRSEKLVGEIDSKFSLGAEVVFQLEPALQKHHIIIDACPAPEFIDEGHINTDTFIAAPGIPLGINTKIVEKVSQRLLHDPLEIGVATMILDVLKKGESYNGK